MRTVKIAGKQYELRYTLRERARVESITKKSLFDSMFGGILEDQAAVLWAGIVHADKRLTPARVVDMLEEHQQKDEAASYDEVLREAYYAVCEARLLGRMDASAMRKLIGDEGNDQGEAPAQS